MKDKPDTIAVSAGRMSEAHFGAVNTPVYRASTILFPSLAALEARTQEYSYGRRGTPTSRSLEEAICALEGGARTVLVPSGLNACATAILSVAGAGDHLLMLDSCYEPTRDFCDKVLKRFGVETTYYPPTADITPYLKPNTKAVFCESPGSLTFEVQDIPAIAGIAHAHGASVLMDNTWATPLLFPALTLGVDLSIQAVTKYIGGHADVNMGAITANDPAASVSRHIGSGLWRRRYLPGAAGLAHHGRAAAAPPGNGDETCLVAPGPARSDPHSLSCIARRSRLCPVAARFQGCLRIVRL